MLPEFATFDLTSALFGAIAAGGLTWVTSWSIDRKRRAEEVGSLRAVLSSEIYGILSLAKTARYDHWLGEKLAGLQPDALAIRKAHVGSAVVRIDPLPAPSGYFGAYEGIAPRLGLLAPEEARAVVRFYLQARAFASTVGPAAVATLGPLTHKDAFDVYLSWLGQLAHINTAGVEALRALGAEDLAMELSQAAEGQKASAAADQHWHAT